LLQLYSIQFNRMKLELSLNGFYAPYCSKLSEPLLVMVEWGFLLVEGVAVD